MPDFQKSTDDSYNHVTTDRSKVDIPEWARDIEVGDTVDWRHGDGSGSDEIIGFSTLPSNRGLPVIEAPDYAYDDHVADCETVVLEKKVIVDLETLTHPRRGKCEDFDMLERYDPEASDAIATECPGCGGVIVVFQSGTVVQPRTEPVESGTIPTMMDAAFERHHCPARPGLFACEKCGDRYDGAEEADRCCSGPYEEQSYVLVEGADPKGDDRP